jgi:hypothetical protein
MTGMTDGAAGDQDRAGWLLGEIRAIRSRTSAAARGYWLPLLLFGALICGSLAFYEILPLPRQVALAPAGAPGCAPGIAGPPCHGPAGHVTVVVTALGWYWQLAIPAGVIAAVLWYRWRGQRTGLRTPSLPFLVTGLVLGELVLLAPLLISQAGPRLGSGLIHDSRQSGPLVIIAVLLWVLAWAERSRGLALITAGYLVIAVATSFLDNGGLAGGTTGAANLPIGELRLIGLLPALILLAAGVAAGLARQRRLRA